MVIRAWCQHIRRVLYIEKAITWNDVPGYKEIVTAMLEEIQESQLIYFKEAQIEAMKSFVVNPKLMNPLIKLAFKKTSKYDSLAVMKAMDLTSILFFKINSKDL